jgi:Mu-like prophage protein gp29
MVTKARLLGPDGEPIDSAMLSGSLAAPTESGARSIPRDNEATGLTPEKLAKILKDAVAGNARSYLTLATDMEERYLHYASQLQTRRLAFDAVPATVTSPKGVPSKIIDAVNELVEGNGFRDACMDLTDGLAKGYGVVEPIWEYEAKLLQPVLYQYRDPRFFTVDKINQQDLRLLTDDNQDGIPLPPAGFIVHKPRTRSGLPLRVGLARPAAWAFLIQSFTLQDWAAFCELYGIPFRLGKYPQQASEADKRNLLRAVRDFANDAAAIVPAGTEIEFHSINGNQGQQVFGGLLGYLDRQVSKLVVGQTMTADEGSSLSQAKVHNDVRLDILRADCRQMAATINRDLIRFFVAMNFGPQDQYPQVDFPVAEPEDIKALGDLLHKAVPLGLKVSQREVREKVGLSEPQQDEDILGAPATTASEKTENKDARLSLHHGHGCMCPSCAGSARLASVPTDAEKDDIDRLGDDALSDWEEITDPLLESLFALAAECSSFDEVLERLDSLRLDSGPLRERLAKAMAISRGLGDVKDT